MTYPEGERNILEGNIPGIEDDASRGVFEDVQELNDDVPQPSGSEIIDIVHISTARAKDSPKVLLDNAQLREDLVRAGDNLEKVRGVDGGRPGNSLRILTLSTSSSASSNIGDLEVSSIFYPNARQHHSNYSIDRTPSTINEGFTTPLKCEISALPIERSTRIWCRSTAESLVQWLRPTVPVLKQHYHHQDRGRVCNAHASTVHIAPPRKLHM